jgi:DNA-directed RNA polymerase specialized sigma24 family protein
MPRIAFTALDRDWTALVRSDDATAALDRWHDDVRLRAASLDELLDRIWAAPMMEADATCAALARRAADDATAARTLLQALRPGLRTLGRRLALGAAFDDVDHEVIALAWERIRTYPYDRRPRKIAPNVLLDVRKRYLQRIRAEQPDVGLDEISPRLQPATPSAEDDALDSEIPSLQRAYGTLAMAVAAGAISDTAANIIWQTRIVGASDPDVASELGLRLRTMQRRRQRAERQLAAAC